VSEPPLKRSRFTGPGSKPARGNKKWYLLLILPYLGVLYPPLYSRSEPTLFDFPFFYWYQFMWVPLSALLSGIAYLAARRSR
jgi:hypothetical protein